MSDSKGEPWWVVTFHLVDGKDVMISIFHEHLNQMIAGWSGDVKMLKFDHEAIRFDAITHVTWRRP